MRAQNCKPAEKLIFSLHSTRQSCTCNKKAYLNIEHNKSEQFLFIQKCNETENCKKIYAKKSQMQFFRVVFMQV